MADKQPSLKDFEGLEEEIRKNMNNPIPKEHWAEVHRMQAELAEEFEAQERALTPTDADMKRCFTI